MSHHLKCELAYHRAGTKWKGVLSRRHTWRFYTITILSPGVLGSAIAIFAAAYKIADIWHFRYRRLNSPAFAKCARSRDFLRSSLQIASKVNQSGWAFLSHDFSKRPSLDPRKKVEVPHPRDWRKKSPGLSASIGGENRDQIRRDRRIKSPGMWLALATTTATANTRLQEISPTFDI